MVLGKRWAYPVSCLVFLSLVPVLNSRPVVVPTISGFGAGNPYLKWLGVNPTVTSSVIYILALMQLCLGANTQFFSLDTAIKQRVGWAIVATQLLAIFLSLLLVPFVSFVIVLAKVLFYTIMVIIGLYGFYLASNLISQELKK